MWRQLRHKVASHGDAGAEGELHGAGKRRQADATADVIRAGARTSVVRCEITREDGEVCAAGLGTFMMRRVHETDPDDMPPPPAS